MMLFSERYGDFVITDEDGMSQDCICDDICDDVKTQLAKILRKYDEPKEIHPSIFDDSYTEETSALQLAITSLNDRKGYPCIQCDFFISRFADPLAYAFTPYFFDLVELLYSELSDEFKGMFQSEINSVFSKCNVAWIMFDGEMLKLDQKAFEQKLKIKTMEKMQVLKDAQPAFQSACDEFQSAVELFTKGNYAEAITDAGRSYESVMKIICEDNELSAEKLTQQIIKSGYCDLPETVEKDKFRRIVLMSLPLMRNSVGAHGNGSSNGRVSKSFANLAVNLAAALDTYLIEECSDRLRKMRDGAE